MYISSGKCRYNSKFRNIYLNSPQIEVSTYVSIKKVKRKSAPTLGTIYILRKNIGVGWWFRKWEFSLTLCTENVLT